MSQTHVTLSESSACQAPICAVAADGFIVNTQKWFLGAGCQEHFPLLLVVVVVVVVVVAAAAAAVHSSSSSSSSSSSNSSSSSSSNNDNDNDWCK